MHKALSYKTKQFFFVLIKISLVVGAFYFIYLKLTNNKGLSFYNVISFSLNNNAFSFKNICFLLVLSFFNWFFEILKWQNLVYYVKPISFNAATKQSLGALTASLFTPNRIGEYGAKAMYFTSNLRKRVMLVNLLSNLLQMGVTCFFGIIGFGFYISIYNPEFNYFKLVKFIAITFILITIFTFGITKSKFKIKGFSIKKLKLFSKEFPKQKLIIGVFFSVIRYVFFSFQFYVLLYIFKVDLNYFNAMIIITTMYLLASIIPSIFIFDVVVKGSIAVYLFSLAGVNDIIILCIITIMWLLNFVLPSLFGSYFVLSFSLPKSQ